MALNSDSGEKSISKCEGLKRHWHQCVVTATGGITFIRVPCVFHPEHYSTSAHTLLQEDAKTDIEKGTGALGSNTWA
jgi:hypothetical protein